MDWNKYRSSLIRLNSEISVDNHFLLEITNLCKFNCIYCFRKSSKFSKNIEALIPSESVVDIVERMFKIGFKSVTLSGGDAGLHPKLVEIVNKIRDKTSVKIGIFSSLLKKDVAEKIKEKVDLVGVSLDGDRKSHNYLRGPESYEMTKATIKNLKKNKIPFSIHSTITPFNYGCIPKIVKMSKKLGALSVRLSHVIPVGRGDNEKLFLSEEQLDDLWNMHRKLENKFQIPIFTSLCDRDFFIENQEVITSLIVNITTNYHVLPHLAIDEKYSLGNLKYEEVSKVISRKNIRIQRVSNLFKKIYMDVVSKLKERKIEKKWIPFEDILLFLLNKPKCKPSYLNSFISS